MKRRETLPSFIKYSFSLPWFTSMQKICFNINKFSLVVTQWYPILCQKNAIRKELISHFCTRMDWGLRNEERNKLRETDQKHLNQERDESEIEWNRCDIRVKKKLPKRTSKSSQKISITLMTMIKQLWTIQNS